MGFFDIFNCIETFFFISLGITFVLILMLIYHFKQQISTQEQKSDTMFEIINSIVSEITSIKNQVISFPSRLPFFCGISETNETNEKCSMPDKCTINKIQPPIENIVLTELQCCTSGDKCKDVIREVNKDDMIFDESDSDSEYDTDDANDSENDGEDTIHININNIDDEKIVVSDDDDANCEEIDILVDEIEDLNVSEVSEVLEVSEVFLDDLKVSEVSEVSEVSDILVEEALDSFTVDKLGTDILESYRKKTTNELKQIAQEKKLHTTSKMKKDDLIRLLSV